MPLKKTCVYEGCNEDISGTDMRFKYCPEHSKLKREEYAAQHQSFKSGVKGAGKDPKAYTKSKHKYECDCGYEFDEKIEICPQCGGVFQWEGIA